MKLCEGKIVELDSNKWYWLVIDPKTPLLDQILGNIIMENGQIILAAPGEIEFIENPDKIKGIIVKEF